MSTLAEKFTLLTGSKYYLEPDKLPEIQTYLQKQQVIHTEEQVIAAPAAGEGNMNVTLRVSTSTGRRFIVKQSRPWVAKYPDLEAPVERILVERDFLEVTLKEPVLAAFSPALRHVDEENFCLAIEEITPARDLSAIYAKGQPLADGLLQDMLTYLSHLHQLEATDFPPNRALRKLNHAHIFDLPFHPDNGFPLADIFPGLDVIAKPLQNDAELREKARKLGERYLTDEGGHLLHGDFYPGSLLDQNGKLFVIDGEFAFRGPAEFDLGVLTAHLLLAQASPEQLQMIDAYYKKPPGFNVKLARQFAYVEIIRRLIGIAQLPLTLSLEERGSLLEEARQGLR
ncbi:MAG: phosphotransferase [Bacteroidota bacterium]